MNKISDLQKAKQFLSYRFPKAFTPDGVKDKLKLSISSSTLARKFRAAAQNGELWKWYYTNEKGKSIVTYAYNITFFKESNSAIKQKNEE